MTIGYTITQKMKNILGHKSQPNSQKEKKSNSKLWQAILKCPHQNFIFQFRKLNNSLTPDPPLPIVTQSWEKGLKIPELPT